MLCHVPPLAPMSVNGPGALRRVAPPLCVREGSMSTMERTTYRRSLGSNTWALRTPNGSAAPTLLDWHRKDASLGSADAQRLSIQLLHTSGGCRASLS